jgi:hypothetical protein
MYITPPKGQYGANLLDGFLAWCEEEIPPSRQAHHLKFQRVTLNLSCEECKKYLGVISRLRHFRALLCWAERNESIPYIEALVATALAVGLVGHTVMVWRLDQGQWMINFMMAILTASELDGCRGAKLLRSHSSP